MLAITAIVSPLTKILYKPKVRVDTWKKHEKMKAIQTMPQVSKFRIISLVHSEENVLSMISLLEASNPTEESPICAYVTHLMELVDQAAPLLNHLNKRKRRSFMKFSGSYSSSDHILSTFENYATNANSGRVTRAIQGNRIATAIRDLNTNIQTYDTYTVGVLVDRGFRAASRNHFSYHVAVVSIGGQDDCVALSYEAHMSGHVDVRVTVMRIIVRDKKWENEVEKLDRFLDDDLFDELKIKSVTDAFVVCREVMVEDSVALVEARSSFS
ncbi:hypothetical protein FH972_001265 [Carpinus fangiana]|uniref:Uncharacterized protein n=1 Tax=Carpinus fangiana TaxID=176857 RepID=A0A5N6QDM5_9ROSI|nr:hypothetical protein FH972_001265 [Carpinus fangiana]